MLADRQSSRTNLAAILAALALACSTIASAETAAQYPSRPIRIVVPLPPGATADTMPRIIGEKLQQRWGQSVVIENRAGAAQNLGAEYVAKSEPDGYTLLATPPSPLAVNQNLFIKLAFDPSAFVPISIMGVLPSVLIAKKDAPFSTLPDFIAYARANPDKLNYGSAGTGSTPHLLMLWLMSKTGTRLVHVPYKGSAPALTDMLAGHIDVMFDNIGNPLELIKGGQIKGLGIGSAKRIAELPDVPAMVETVADFVAATWFAIVAPPKTPAEIADKLSATVAEVLRLPDIAARFKDMAATPVGGTRQDTAAFIAAERELWAKVAAAAGIKPE